MRCGSILLLLIVSAVSVCAQRVAAGKYEVSGTVVNAQSGQPLESVEVALAVSRGQGAPWKMKTASDGHFAFSGVAADKYTLSALRRGFSQQLFEQHENFSSAIVTGPDLVSTGLVFRLQPDASIAGTVLDDHNEPVQNARIILFRDSVQSGRRAIRQAGFATTNDIGMYRIGHLRPGRYYVAVAAQPWVSQYVQPRFGATREGLSAVADTRRQFEVAYPLTYYGDVTDASSASPIEVTAGERASADITLREVPAAHIRLLSATEMQWREFRQFRQAAFPGTEIDIPTRTMSNGQVTEIIGLPPGRYLFDVTGSDGKGAQRRFRREVEVSGDTDIDLNQQESSPPTVTGVLRRGTAQNPLTVMLQGRSQERSYFARVEPDGSFRFEQSPMPGSYYLQIGGGAYVVTAMTATGARVNGLTVDITGDARLEVTAMAASAHVDGIALRDGKPVPGAMIVLVPANLTANLPLVRRDQSDSDGTFTLPAVAPGHYTAVALANWKLEWSSPAVLKPYLSGGTPVDVGTAEAQKITVNVQE